jgi:hypothetical protein
MRYTPDTSPASQSLYYTQVTSVLLRIRDYQASGRLSLYNQERFGLAHLYFREALLIHVAGDKSGGEAVLRDMLTWRQARVRFDWEVRVPYQGVSRQEAELFALWLSALEDEGATQGASELVDGLTQQLGGFVLRHSGSYPVVTEPIKCVRAVPQIQGSRIQWSDVAETPFPSVASSFTSASNTAKQAQQFSTSPPSKSEQNHGFTYRIRMYIIGILRRIVRIIRNAMS